MAVVTSPASAANSYVTTTEAANFMVARLNSDAYTGASSETQEAALRQAARLIDTQTFDGDRTTSTQLLQWPRSGVVDPTASGGGSSCNYYYGTGTGYIDANTVPQFVKDAQCEMALWLLVNDDQDTIKLRRDFQSVALGSLNVTTRPVYGFQLPPEVAVYFRGTLQGQGTRQLVRTG